MTRFITAAAVIKRVIKTEAIAMPALSQGSAKNNAFTEWEFGRRKQQQQAMC